MMLLAIDTATRMTGIALHDGSHVLAESVWLGVDHHTVELAPEVAIMLCRVGGTPTSLTGLAVAQGPGSYTGLRIGMALAKGLALAHNLPLVGIPTFDILARNQPHRPETMLAVIQAGRNRIAGMWYKWGHNGWQSQAEAENLAWADVLERLGERTYVCGEIDSQGREALANKPHVVLAPPAQCIRRPSFLAELAWEQVRSGKVSDPAALSLIYLKPRGESAS